MSKRFQILADRIKPLAIGHGACFATDMITVDGHQVGYMYRQKPEHDTDSGWVFTAGTESPQYMDNPENLAIYDVNTIANYDPEIIPLLEAESGSAFVRDPESGEFFEEDLVPPEAPATAITAEMPDLSIPPSTAITAEPARPRGVCDECSCPIRAGEAVLRSKTVTPAVVVHYDVHLMLCPRCAAKYDDTGNRMMWGMAAFVAVMGILGVGSWILSLVFR
jgi:hypothetical protein